jgi:PAS domain S-box-containing protein
MDYRSGNLRFSETQEALYGLSPGTFEGTFEAFIDRVHPDDREALLDLVRTATQSGEDFTIQTRAVWPDGTVRWLRGIGRIHFDEHGEPVRAIGISQDVTEQRRTDAELQRLNDEIQIQRLRVFRATMTTVQDIVNNLLNGLQLVHLDEEYLPTAEIRPLVDQVIREAAVKLETLGNLETIIEKEMIVGPGIDYPGA